MSITIFSCYAHEDEALFKKLKSHMGMLQRQGLVYLWHDRDITAGTEREQAISKHLDEAQIILLLVSPDFINSEYCYSAEMQRAMERHEAGTAHVIPIILRPTDRKGTSFEKLQALPSDDKPVTTWRNRDEAFLAITQGIRQAVEELHSPEKSGEPFVVENTTANVNIHEKNEKLNASSNSTASMAVLHIPLIAENLTVDSYQLKKNLRNLYGREVKEVKVQIDMNDLGANLIKTVEETCRRIETNELNWNPDQRLFILERLRDRSELWPICLPLYEENLATLLARLVEKIFSSQNHSLQALTLTCGAIEKTLEYVHYQLVAYLQGVIFPCFARDCGFPALAAYLEKYEGYGLDQKSRKQALQEIYKYHQINVDSPQTICLVKSRSKNTVYWQVFLPRVNEDDRIGILGNCPPFMVIDGYTWDVFVLPQVIGNALMESSFGEGKRIEELPYKIGLTMRDYEYVGFP